MASKGHFVPNWSKYLTSNVPISSVFQSSSRPPYSKLKPTNLVIPFLTKKNKNKNL